MMTSDNVQCRTVRGMGLAPFARCGIAAAILAMASLPGCGKPPTFQELMGNKPPEDIQAPAARTSEPLPPPGGQQPAPAAAPQKVDPAAVVAQFKALRSHEIEDRHLDNLAKLESGHELLDEIKAAGSKVTDAGLQSISRFTGLKTLDLAGTTITDSGLVEIGKAVSLEKLILNSTRITDAGVAELKNLVNLKELSISGTAVTDDGFPAFKKLTNLETMRCSSMNINGKGFDVFHDQGSASSLREIEAHHSGFGAYGFQSIKGMNKIEKLDLGQSGTSDASLRGINTSLRGVKWLELGYNGVTDQGALLLGGLTKLEHVGLRNNTMVTNNSILKAFGTRHKELVFLDLEGTGCSAAVVGPLKKHNKDLQIIVGGQAH